MEQFLELLESNYVILGIIVALIVIFLILVFVCVKYSKLQKNYNNFMKKVGNGENLQEDLETFMYKVDKVEKQNAEINEYCKALDNQLEGCIQKIGIIRYNAFKDPGSDLSFALAMLDDKNNGVVMNGIYSREMSNIYAKPVENGKSSYTLSEEEKMAIDKAVNSKGIYKVQ